MNLFGNKTDTDKVSTFGAYNVWRTTVERSVNLQHAQSLKNFIKDQDFLNYIEKLLKEVEKEIEKLRANLEKLAIAGPNPSPSDKKFNADKESFTDQGIAEAFYRFIRLDLISLLINSKYVPISNELFEYFVDLIKTSIKRVDKHIEYMKNKNWLYFPPEFPSVPENKEKVALNDIFLLWDHLNFRYNNLRKTQLYAALAQDKDFVLILNAGIHKLKDQIKVLEDKLLKYGVPLPRPYSNIVPQNELSKEFFEDRFIFNDLLRGMQDALALHGSAIQEILVNDELREFFIKLTYDEIEVVTSMVKYGKLRGWAMVPPVYSIS